jgi:hypothetical protein
MFIYGLNHHSLCLFHLLLQLNNMLICHCFILTLNLSPFHCLFLSAAFIRIMPNFVGNLPTICTTTKISHGNHGHVIISLTPLQLSLMLPLLTDLSICCIRLVMACGHGDNYCLITLIASCSIQIYLL